MEAGSWPVDYALDEFRPAAGMLSGNTTQTSTAKRLSGPQGWQCAQVPAIRINDLTISGCRSCNSHVTSGVAIRAKGSIPPLFIANGFNEGLVD